MEPKRMAYGFQSGKDYLRIMHINRNDDFHQSLSLTVKIKNRFISNFNPYMQIYTKVIKVTKTSLAWIVLFIRTT